MPRPLLADVEVSGGDLALVVVVAAIALVSLAMAVMFRSEVLRAGEGTPNMQRIAQAVQEGANAYLTRQFRTLSVFAAIAFVVLLALPADAADGASGLQSEWAVRIFRSIFFLVGAGFSGAIGFLGMSLAVRANLRVAAAANEQGRDPAMNIGFRTGAVVGMG
ncbi:MAG TPA: sodium/proton-translocating pyrophosphatase, partial [Nocardioides sp.]|nr:sodium/proton-translocating pyrophosphatase [Nocardioides sp.]